MELDLKSSVNQYADRVLEFYYNRGIVLKRGIKFLYVDKANEFMPDTLAMVKEELEFKKRFEEFLGRSLGHFMWREAYHLEISENSLEEIIGVVKNLVSQPILPEYFDSGADVVIFKPYTTLPEQTKEEVLAHEIWHLIEVDHKVFNETPFIIEGTATYVMKKYRNKKCEKTLEACEDVQEMMYLGAANLVGSYVNHLENPFKAILDLQLRQSMQQDLLHQIKPVMLKGLKRTFEDENFRNSYRSFLMKSPFFRDLERNLTKENILKLYKNLGANNLVRELEQQDLTHLIEWFKLLGF